MFQAFSQLFTSFIGASQAQSAANLEYLSQKEQQAIEKEQIIAQRNYNNKKLEQALIIGLLVVFVLFILFVIIRKAM